MAENTAKVESESFVIMDEIEMFMRPRVLNARITCLKEPSGKGNTLAEFNGSQILATRHLPGGDGTSVKRLPEFELTLTTNPGPHNYFPMVLVDPDPGPPSTSRTSSTFKLQANNLPPHAMFVLQTGSWALLSFERERWIASHGCSARPKVMRKANSDENARNLTITSLTLRWIYVNATSFHSWYTSWSLWSPTDSSS
jgi:hypothetical protein